MILKYISDLVMPVIIVMVLAVGLCKRKDVYDIFVKGAGEGIRLSLDILPSIIGLMMAIEMINSCGVLELVVEFLKPALTFLGVAPEVLPLAILRPISGSASMGIVNDVLIKSGPDSYAGELASVMMGSTETTFYTIALFYGSIGIKDTGKTVFVALIGDFVSIVASVIFCQLFF